MSLLYFLSKFSQEALLIELFFIGCILVTYFGYLLTKKRKWGAAKENIPDNVVRAFLVELIGNAEGFKNQLFGENFKIHPGEGLRSLLHSTDAPITHDAVDAPAGTGNTAEAAALKAQLQAALQKQEELTKAATALEAKLATAATGAAPAAGGSSDADNALKEKLAKLEAKLAEYGVIEDDLANLKKYQQENKKLKEQLAAGGAPATAASAAPAITASEVPAAVVIAEAIADPATPTAPVNTSPIAKAEEKLNQTEASKNFEGLVDKIEESLTVAPPATEKPKEAPLGASVEDPKQPTTTVLNDAASTASPAIAPIGEKSDADLLNEFERMLNS